MKCPKCGNENRIGAKFCGKCGTQLPPAQPPKGHECPQCGKQNRAGIRYCEYCGAALKAVPPQAPQEIKCPQCSKQNRTGIPFCEYCGASLTEVPAKPVQKVKRKRRKWVAAFLFTGILITVVCVGAVLSYQYLTTNEQFLRLPNVGDWSTMTAEDAEAIGLHVIQQEYPELADMKPAVQESQLLGHRIYQVSFSPEPASEGETIPMDVIITIDTQDETISIFASN